jgi:hypothetical protein
MIYRVGNRILVKLGDGDKMPWQREKAERAVKIYARAYGLSLEGEVEFSGSAFGYDIFNQRIAA